MYQYVHIQNDLVQDEILGHLPVTVCDCVERNVWHALNEKV